MSRLLDWMLEHPVLLAVVVFSPCAVLAIGLAVSR